MHANLFGVSTQIDTIALYLTGKAMLWYNMLTTHGVARQKQLMTVFTEAKPPRTCKARSASKESKEQSVIATRGDYATVEDTIRC